MRQEQSMGNWLRGALLQGAIKVLHGTVVQLASSCLGLAGRSSGLCNLSAACHSATLGRLNFRESAQAQVLTDSVPCEGGWHKAV